jgi:SpoIIAA-like
MIELLTDMPPGTIGFRVSGKIEREDYDNVLTPELERALAAGQLRSLYLVEDMGPIEPGAWWADSKLGFDLAVRHRDAFLRTAVVTDIRWMAEATSLFAWMIPGEVRVFPLADVDAAKTWVSGG